MSTITIPAISNLDECLMSITRHHSGELNRDILKRKIDDTKNIGRTFWYYRSSRARPDVVQSFAQAIVDSGKEPWCVFIAPAPSRPSKGSTYSTAHSYSTDMRVWSSLPSGLTKVTGYMRGAYALVLDFVDYKNGAVDLETYVEVTDPSLPLEFEQHRATQCVRLATTPTGGMPRNRDIRLIGRLVKPYAVWLRA